MSSILVRANVAIRDLRAGEVGSLEWSPSVESWIGRGWVTVEPDQVIPQSTLGPGLTATAATEGEVVDRPQPGPPPPAAEPTAAPPPAELPQVPDDYDTLTIEQVKAWVNDAVEEEEIGQRAAVALEAEEAGKNRSTLVEWLQTHAGV